MKEEAFPSKGEVEEMVFKYVLANTPGDYSGFNPVKLESTEIVRNNKTQVNFVNDALENLSKDAARIEKVSANFEFWLPLNENGKKIKHELFVRNIAFPNLLFLRFVILIGLFYVTKGLIAIEFVELKLNMEYFVVGVIATGLSILAAKYLSNRLLLLNERVRGIKYFKWFVWSFIGFTSLIVFIWNRGLHETRIIGGVLFFVSIAANVLGILAFAILMLKRR